MCIRDRDKGTQGTCRVRVVIDTAGRLSTPMLMDKVSPACDEEALKLINILSNQPDAFLPGSQARKKVKVSLIIPVEFNIDKWKKEVTRRKKLLEEAIKQDSSVLKIFIPEIKD